MTLIDDDEVEKIRWVFAKVRRRFSVFRLAAHERLEDCKEDASVLRYFAFLSDVTRRDAHQRIFRKRRECVIGLIGENISVGKEKNARPSPRFARKIPTT